MSAIIRKLTVQVVLKGIEWPDQLTTKRNRELLVSLPPRNVHILCVQRNTKEMEVNSLLLKHCFASPRGKNRQKLLCIGSKLSWFKFVFLLLGNDKDYDS